MLKNQRFPEIFEK